MGGGRGRGGLDRCVRTYCTRSRKSKRISIGVFLKIFFFAEVAKGRKLVLLFHTYLSYRILKQQSMKGHVLA